MMPNICDANLTGFELAIEMELISATLNTMPFKQIVRETNCFTLSPKALLFPIMSFQEVRNWLLHVGDQLNTLESWDGYDKLRSRNQSFLQHPLKEFLYNCDNDPIIATRVILRGKNVMIEVHSSTMGLLSRDPAAIKKDEVAAAEDTPQLDNNQQVDLQAAIEALINGGNHV